MHKLEIHPEKIKPSRNPENCEFTNCWYKHVIPKIKENIRTNEPSSEQKEEQKVENFQKAQINPKPNQ